MITWIKRIIARRKARRTLKLAAGNFFTLAKFYVREMKKQPDKKWEMHYILALIHYGRDVRQIASEAERPDVVHRINNQIIEVAKQGQVIAVLNMLRGET